MRTLGIIGGGIVGKSLLFSLAREKRQKYDRVILFESEDFAKSCTLSSTAIVAARGVLRGISPLGDSIYQGIEDFKKHVRSDQPQGVYPIYQISSAQRKMDYFKRRYPVFEMNSSWRSLTFKKELPLYVEEAFYVAPAEYCQWLLKTAKSSMNIEHYKDFVVSVDKELNITTLNGQLFKVDHLVLAGSVKNKLWSSLVSDRRVTQSKSVKGSFLLFKNIDWGSESYSISMDDLNLIYRAPAQELLIGATSEQSQLYRVNEKDSLKMIYDYFLDIISLPLPDFKEGEVCTGLREKSIKREPYAFTNHNVSFIGGLYKNGFTLSLKMATDLVNQLP